MDHERRNSVLRLNLAPWRASRQGQRLEHDATFVTSSRTIADLTIDRTSTPPCAILSIRLDTASNTTIFPVFAIHHLKVSRTIFDSFSINRRTTLEHWLVPLIHTHRPGAPVSRSHCLTISTNRHCLLVLGTISRNHLWPKAGLLNCQKGCMGIGLRVSPTDSVQPKPVKTLPHRPTTCRQRRARECRSV
jgi:hypothetical protein